MAYALIIWTMVAAGSSGRVYTDWRVLTEHRTQESCEDAAKKLGYASSANYRCVKL